MVALASCKMPDGEPSLLQEAQAALTRADFPAIIRLLHERFGASTWSLRALRRDAQRHIVPLILDAILAETEIVYRQLYEPRIPLLRTLTHLHMPAPKALQTAAEYLLNLDVRRAFEEDDLDLTRLSTLLEDAGKAHLTLDAMTLQPAISQGLVRLMARLVAHPSDLALLHTLADTMRLVRTLPFASTCGRCKICSIPCVTPPTPPSGTVPNRETPRLARGCTTSAPLGTCCPCG